MKILITGGAGTLGRALLRPLRESGHIVRILTRRPRPESTPADVEWVRGDISTADNLTEAVNGTDLVIHAASDPRNSDAVDILGTRRILDAAKSAGTYRIFYISIAGIDEIPFTYYRKKLEAEHMVEDSGINCTILRATQFHSLIHMLISAAARVPVVMHLPVDFKFRSVDESEVAERIARAVASGESGRLRDFGGPETMKLGDMVKMWQEHFGVSKKIIRLPLPGAVPKAFRAGKNTAPDGDRGRIGWVDWLKHKKEGRSG